MTTQMIVPIRETETPVHAYDMTDPNNPIRIEAGTVITRQYEGENVQRLAFHSTQGDKEYRMGATSDKFQFVDHTDTIEPFLNAGYTLKKFHTFRGGLQMQATLSAPASVVPVQDPINWDYDFWTERLSQGGVDGNLYHSVTITSGIKPGKGISIDRGWYRLVCTNGMMAKILDLGGLRFNHTSFNVSVIEQKFLGAGNLKSLTAPKIDSLMGPYLGSLRGADRLANLLDTLSSEIGHTNDDEDSEDEETEEVSNRQLRKLKAAKDLPYYLNDLVTPFSRQPLWFLKSASDQLKALASQTDRDRVYALDVVNAMTNPVNLVRGQFSARPVLNQSSLTEAASRLVGAFSL